MTERRSKQISSRKQPQQARSAELVSAILTAAIQVLAQEGAARFTTARVAERAGVSVGSLYQYFPNKAAILFRLQSEEWRQTTDMLSRILVNREKTPVERLRLLVQAFIRSECEEAQMRVALNDAAPLYRDAPEALAVKATGKDIVQVFMREALPDVPPVARRLAGDLIVGTLGAAGKQFSETPRTDTEIASYADAMADMFCAYLADLNGRVAR
ncbi:TetR family transcriptional regulator [Serratia marcescens]|jgi:AcrR family transcriptional regulator|uniref:TetR family transcriptional regulator n=1 Tax=Serratia marcescens TaxID=615 RepID=A0AA46QCP3_SERMA|nr:TetR family transcriptional regulator [Serratia marcescens]MBI6122556.1 TetR family transcriptional regulator [Serratia marcescens]TQI84344.1 TetR family transcriptional regulator [Serratia marcescens]BEM53091.1 TetR family transcriptional regulator [Serratia marcescens]HEJ7118594.1 TetR family transcriptional regulator [Serratia marcescens]HEJ7932247.1 TetR family transcriptional regulator [Serratia marcescens]